MIFDLPADLVEEILCRIPSTSIKRLGLTCKRWNALFKDPIFTNKHFGKAPKQFQFIMFKEFKICSMSVNLDVAPPSIEFKGELGLKDPHSSSDEQFDIAHVFHCDGLLLCKTKNKRLVVWNPCSGETRWIQPKTFYKNSSMFALGYQLDNKSCRRYKFLRCCNNDNSDVCEIYEFSCDTWRVFDHVLDYFTPENGVSLKGNSYWNVVDDRLDHCLLCFDFTRERFRRMSLPPSQNHSFFMALSVVREEQLSVLHRRTDIPKMEIWVTNKFDAEVALLWRKVFTVDLNTRVNSSLLIDEEKKMALCCGVRHSKKENKVYTISEDDGYCTEVPFPETTDKPWRPFIINYVPSLVQTQ